MHAQRFGPILVTFLLILVYGSGSLFVTGLTFVFIAIVATFICFVFKIQIDFEFLFSLIEKFQAISYRGIGNNNINGRKKGSFEFQPLKVSTGSFKDLPRPIARKLKLIIDGVMNEFVESWYIEVCPEDRDFIDETRRALEQIAVEGYKRICRVDTHSAAVNLINLLTSHLKMFNDCRDVVNSKYPGINASDFEKCVTELYETRITQHVSSKSQGAMIDFLKRITDILLYVLLPKNSFSCEGGRFMLREILAIQGLKRLVDLLSDPHFVNKALIDIFEDPVPMEQILQSWKDELEKDLVLEDELDEIEESENKVDSDVYESATEGRKMDAVKEKRSASKWTKQSSFSSIDQTQEISDNFESKFATPRHSTTEWSSDDESFEAFGRVLRQNQLEARSSAPVYGSMMVKLHEESGRNKVPNLDYPIQGAKYGSIPNYAQGMSGRLAEPVKLRSSSAPMESNSKNQQVVDLSVNDLERVSNNAGGLNDREILTFAEHNTRSKVVQIEENGEDETWNECPPPGSSYYRKVSYKQMNRSQDLFKEQVKAKLHAIGSNVSPTCLTSGRSRTIVQRHSSLPELTHSFEGSVAFSIPENHDYLEIKAPMVKDIDMVKDQLEINEDSKETIVKIHSVPERNVFYEVAPDCPTCIEMTALANPLENGKAVLTVDPKSTPEKVADHECGLSFGHFYHPEVDDEEMVNNDSDVESFVSCESDSLTDLDDSVASIASESTLLASSESMGNGSDDAAFQNLRKLKLKIDTKSTSVESFDIVSMKGSDSEFSSANDFEQTGSTQCLDDMKYDLTEESDLKEHRNRLEKAPSITTFASAFDLSSGEPTNTQNFKTPFKSESAPKLSAKDFKSKTLSLSKRNMALKPGMPAKFLKSLKELRLRRIMAKEEIADSSDDERGDSVPDLTERRTHHPLSRDKKKRLFLEKFKFQGKKIQRVNGNDNESEAHLREFQSSFSGTTDSDESLLQHVVQTPSNVLPYEDLVKEWNQEAMKIEVNAADEVADEISEDIDPNDCFKDAHSIFNERFDDSLSIVAESVDSQDGSKLEDDISVVAEPEIVSKIKPGGVIAVYEGEVILPHPSKMFVSAWMYPMQMISIPTTEVAFEKGWEPGGNKYTLYSIHYDIRIWPEIYQVQMIEASQKSSENEDSKDGIPIIREIKRRYREFMYLHNRLTHSHMSAYMKGVLKPNRRYGMPFGRMDPDVIAGRRKILETYLVSLVSRPEVCNSREFKEFLGAEGYGVASFLKHKEVQPKQMVNKMMGSMKNPFPGSKDVVGLGESSQYFIHGYDVPRMFGYAEASSLVHHSSPWFSSFVDVHLHRDMLPEGETTDQKRMNVMGKIEFFQRPKLIGADFQETGNRDSLGISLDLLGPRSLGDGSDCPEPSRNENGLYGESPDRRFSVGIASLFTNELAAKSKTETLSTLDARKAAEDIPWPLSDAVMSFLCQALKGHDCWVTYENVQQALLYSLGSLLEWQISRAIDEVVIEERWMKYLNDLYHVIWEDGKLKEPLPDPTEKEKEAIKEEALQKMLGFLPGIVSMIIGNNQYRKWGEDLLHALQYQKINRHLLYAAIDLVMGEFIPELQNGFQDYKVSSAPSK